MSGRLILIRHGATAWNAEGRFTTRSDVPLSEAGEVQAREAARALADVPVDRIVTSPLRRARRTAEIIAQEQPSPCPLVVDERLAEVDAGPFEGLTAEEILAGELAAAYAAWRAEESPCFPAGAETYEQALARAGSFLGEHTSLPGTTLVATHGSLIRLIVTSHVLEAPPAKHRRLWLDNGRLAVLEWHDGRPRLLAFNVRSP